MTSNAPTPQAYVDSLPEDRRVFVETLRRTVNAHLPPGFVEAMGYGMLGWAVPHSLYPEGYHCDPKMPLSLAGLASQKDSVNFYHMGLYADPAVLAWFQAEWAARTSARLDMGKSCLRFKRLDQVPLDLIGELMTKFSVEQVMDWDRQARADKLARAAARKAAARPASAP